MKAERIWCGASAPETADTSRARGGANGNAARKLNKRPAPSLVLADRDEASAVAMCLLAKSAGHVSEEVTRKLVAVVNGRATVPDEVVSAWRDMLDGVVPPNDPSSATRPTRRHDCNGDAMAGFAAAHG